MNGMEIKGTLSGGNGLQGAKAEAGRGAGAAGAVPWNGPAIKPALPMEFKTEDVWLAAALLICGFLYWELIRLIALGAGVSVFTAALTAASLGYFKAAGIRQTKRSLPWLGLLLLTGAQFTIFDNYTITIKLFAFLFLSAVYLYWVCVSTGRTLDVRLSVHVLGDMVNQLIVVPFSNFICGVCALTESGKKDRKGGRAVLSVLIGLVVFLPIMVLVTGLLISADPAFGKLMNYIIDAISVENAGRYILHLILGIPVALYLYGLLYGNARGRHTEHITRDAMGRFTERIRFAPRLMVYAPLTVFNAIYLVFYASHLAYLFSAFAEVLPPAMTYAEYARRGFFELCTVAGINLGIMAVTYLLMKREGGADPKGLRVLLLILCAFTLLLIATALSKMVLYIDAYGLTHLRVYTSWFMLLLAFVFVVIVLRLLRRFNASRVIAIGFIVLFMGLCYGNVDGLIAKYNIERFEAGTLESLDMGGWMTSAAFPHLYEFYQTTGDEALKEEIRGQLVWWWGVQPGEESFREFNLQDYRAKQIRLELMED